MRARCSTAYDFVARLVMRVLMRRGEHPTDVTEEYAYTDWDAVDSFGRACRDDGEHRVGARGNLPQLRTLWHAPQIGHDPGEASSPDDGDLPGHAGPAGICRTSSNSRPSASICARTPNTADRSSSKPMSIVSPAFSSDTIEGKAERAVAPSRPFIRIAYKPGSVATRSSC